MNLTDPSLTEGKKLKPSHIKLIAKLSGFGLIAPEGEQIRFNRFSGANKVVGPLVSALVNFIYSGMDCYDRTGGFMYNGHKYPVSVFDGARHLVQFIDPEAYMALID